MYPKEPSRQGNPINWYNCGQPGHIFRDCRRHRGWGHSRHGEIEKGLRQGRGQYQQSYQGQENQFGNRFQGINSNRGDSSIPSSVSNNIIPNNISSNHNHNSNEFLHQHQYHDWRVRCTWCMSRDRMLIPGLFRLCSQFNRHHPRDGLMLLSRGITERVVQ